jgi:hypothetical protein
MFVTHIVKGGWWVNVYVLLIGVVDVDVPTTFERSVL